MTIPRLSDIRNLFPSVRQLNSLRGIQSRQGFHQLIQRERARADRTGEVFSLVCFDATRMDGNAASSLQLLARVLSGRVREIDRVGWYENFCLAVFLPATGSTGAWAFTEDVLGKTSLEKSALESSVYTYPAPWLPNQENKEDCDRKSSTEIPAEKQKTASLLPRVASGMPLWKRCMDIIGALTGLILLSPLFLLIAVVIKLVSPGPVFFRQQRIGHGGKPFTFLKFRTMHVHNDATIHQQYLSSLIKGDQAMEKLDADRDPRIIRFGRGLRQSCLDELPQLINVLRGDMSLVGPRPCLPYEAQEYLQWHARRFDTVPGMTGLWQVSGKNKTTFKEMIRLDIAYSRKISPWLDFTILMKTGPTILGMVFEQLARKLAHSPDPSHATLEKGK